MGIPLCFILENIIFQVVVVERSYSISPSLRHKLTPCLTFRILGGGGEIPIWKSQGWLLENLNLIPKGNLCRSCSSFIKPLKDTTWNKIGSITGHCSKEDPARTVDLTRALVRSAEISSLKTEIKWERLLYCFFECILKDALTGKNSDVPLATP